MWIIPKNLPTSHSVQGTEESTSDSRERLAELFEASLMWRSKPSRSVTWLRRLKADISTQRLSIRTLNASRGDAFEDEWTSSLAGSLVSRLVARDEEPETMTPDTSSPTSSTVCESWDDLPLFSWRTSKGSSHQSSRVTGGQTPKERPFCCMSSESWRGWVTTRRREYSQRVKSAPPINESASLSWRVAPISESQGALLFQSYLSEGEGLDLPAQAQPTPPQEAQSSTHGNRPASQWATPVSRDHKGRRRPIGAKDALYLPDQLEGTWASPIVRDYFEATMMKELPPRKSGARRLDTISRQVHCVTDYTGKLNPRWVETLMGLPVGWTMPSCATPWTIEPTSSAYLETEWSQTQPREPSASCGAISISEDDA